MIVEMRLCRHHGITLFSWRRRSKRDQNKGCYVCLLCIRENNKKQRVRLKKYNREYLKSYVLRNRERLKETARKWRAKNMVYCRKANIKSFYRVKYGPVGMWAAMKLTEEIKKGREELRNRKEKLKISRELMGSFK